MTNARFWLAFASEEMSETLSWRLLPLVRFADKELHAFPTPLHAHGPEAGP